MSIQTENVVWWLPFHCRYLLQLAWSCLSRAVCCWAVQRSKSLFIKHLINGRWPWLDFRLLKFCCGRDSVSEYLWAGCIIHSSSWTAEGTLHLDFLEKSCLTVSLYLRSTQPNCLVDYCDWQCTGKHWEETGKCCMPWASGEPLIVDHPSFKKCGNFTNEVLGSLCGSSLGHTCCHRQQSVGGPVAMVMKWWSHSLG